MRLVLSNFIWFYLNSLPGFLVISKFKKSSNWRVCDTGARTFGQFRNLWNLSLVVVPMECWSILLVFIDLKLNNLKFWDRDYTKELQVIIEIYNYASHMLRCKSIRYENRKRSLLRHLFCSYLIRHAHRRCSLISVIFTYLLHDAKL